MNAPRIWIVSLHSLAMFLLSWIMLFLLLNVMMAVLSFSAEIPMELHFHKSYFLIPPSFWNVDIVKLLFISPLIVSFCYATGCLLVLYYVNQYSGLLKLFFIWGFVHGWAGCFGGMVAGMLTNTGFGYAADWMYLFDTMKLFLSLLSMMFLLLGGFMISRSFQMSANICYPEIKENMFPGFLFFQVTVVVVAGSLIRLFMQIPAPAGLQLVLPANIVMLLPVILKGRGFNDLQFDESVRDFRLHRRLLIATCMVLAIVRLIFGYGIRVGGA